MIYNYFRDYDAVTGRYVESDPIGLAGGLGTYSYVGGNPLRGYDAIGLWPSKWPFDMHQDVIREYIPVGPELMKNLIWAQEYADSAQFQTGANAYRHAMRNKGQSTCEAMSQAEAFVRQQMEWAIFNHNRGKEGPALWQFSEALHTLQDATSPAHIGFQEWSDDPGFLAVLGHVTRESILYRPSERARLTAITKKAWGWYSSGHLPDRFFAEQGANCGCAP